jgi:hypothetical protein
MHPDQKHIFELMACSNKFDDEGMEYQVTHWNVWYLLTPRVFEKEAEDEAIRKARERAAEKAAQAVAERAAKRSQDNPELVVTQENSISEGEDQNPEDIHIDYPKK